MTQQQRFPLSWPNGWRRTPPTERKRANFGRRTTRAGSNYATLTELSMADATARLRIELLRLGASEEILSTNVELRLDGYPRSDRRPPTDPGAAVYFKLKGKPRCLACDRWKRVEDNVAALAAHIEAIRAVDRYGVGTMEQAFAGYAALPATELQWWLILGVPETATREQVLEAHRNLARKHHPDVPGGDSIQMARINRARDAALEAR